MLTYAEPETRTRITDGELNATFMLAVLLSGGERQAEAAMLDAIRQVNCPDVSDHELRRLSLRAAIAAGRELAWYRGAMEDSPSLPVDLNRVLRLPARLRFCFVLRSLGGFSTAECEDLGVFHADEGARAAARELGRMRMAECETAATTLRNSAAYPNCGTQVPSPLGMEITLDLGM